MEFACVLSSVAEVGGEDRLIPLPFSGGGVSPRFFLISGLTQWADEQPPSVVGGGGAAAEVGDANQVVYMPLCVVCRSHPQVGRPPTFHNCTGALLSLYYIK